MAATCLQGDSLRMRTLNSALRSSWLEKPPGLQLKGPEKLHCFSSLRKAPGRIRGRRKAMQLRGVSSTASERTHYTPGSVVGNFGFVYDAGRRHGSIVNKRRNSVRMQAVKKTSPEKVMEEEDWDPDFVTAINQICNKAVRVMLSEDIQLVNEMRKELDDTGATLVEHGEIDAARFILVVQEMLEHKLAPEREQLSGRFREAFEKIFGLVEDAGWSLQPPEEEGQGEGVLDTSAFRDEEPSAPDTRVVEPYNRTFQAQDQFV